MRFLAMWYVRRYVLAQWHNAVTPVMIESAAPRSQVKHSTTEALRSQTISVNGRLRGLRKFGIFIRLELYNTDAML